MKFVNVSDELLEFLEPYSDWFYKQDLSVLDEFIVIVYTFCISMLSDYPEEFFNILYQEKMNFFCRYTALTFE